MALSAGGDAGRHATHAGLLMCQREQRLTFRHLVEQLSLFIVAEFGDQHAGNQRGLRDRLRGQSPPDLGEHHHQLDLAGLLRIEAESEDPDLGEL